MGTTRLKEINDGYIPAEFSVTLDTQEEFYRIWYLLHALSGQSNVKQLLNNRFPALGENGNHVQNVADLANSLKSEMNQLAQDRGYLDIVNDAPAINEEHGNHVSLSVGDSFDNVLQANDPQNGTLTWSLPISPGYLSLNTDSNGDTHLSGEPTEDDIGIHDVVIRVDSDSGLMASIKTYFEVTN